MLDLEDISKTRVTLDHSLLGGEMKLLQMKGSDLRSLLRLCLDYQIDFPRDMRSQRLRHAINSCSPEEIIVEKKDERGEWFEVDPDLVKQRSSARPEFHLNIAKILTTFPEAEKEKVEKESIVSKPGQTVTLDVGSVDEIQIAVQER